MLNFLFFNHPYQMFLTLRYHRLLTHNRERITINYLKFSENLSNDYPKFSAKNKQRLSNDYQNLTSAN